MANIEQCERQHRFTRCSKCRTASPFTSRSCNHSQLTHARCSRPSIKYEYEMKKTEAHLAFVACYWRFDDIHYALSNLIQSLIIVFISGVLHTTHINEIYHVTHSRDWNRKPVAYVNFDISLRGHYVFLMESRSHFSVIGMLRGPMASRFSLFTNSP